MEGQVVLLVLIFAPIIGSFFLPLLGKISIKLRNATALALIVIPIIASAMALLPLLNGGVPYSFAVNMNTPLGNFGFGFLADKLAVFMALASLTIAAIIVIYSFDYMSHYKNQNEYYLMVVLFMGSSFTILPFNDFSYNLFIVFVVTTLSLMVYHFAKK